MSLVSGRDNWSDLLDAFEVVEDGPGGGIAVQHTCG